MKIGLLGFGTVGKGVYKITAGRSDMSVVRVLCRRELELPDAQVTHDFNDILNDPTIDTVVEAIGGLHPAREYVIAAMEAGKNVVTSNKAVVAAYGEELLALAEERGLRYLFEASVGGGIPIIRPMCHDLASNNITEINGILNGTTNYILTKMTRDGASFSDVLKDAQEKGYAERNPAADVEGLDAARKIVILSALAFGKAISPNNIHVEGITDISTEDVEIANELGYSVKLIGHTEKLSDGKILAMVSPRLIPYSNPLSGINDVFNGILLKGDMVGEVMFYGPGAGKLPTASAVCADIVDIVAHEESGMSLPSFSPAEDDNLADFGGYACRRLFIFEKCPECNITRENVEQCFGSVENFVCHGNNVAVVSSIFFTEKAAGLQAKNLNRCKTYRIL